MEYRQAVAERFERCTAKELREFGKEKGLKFGPNTSAETMQRKLLEHAGQAVAGPYASGQAASVTRLRTRSDITPPYNLTFEGAWEGRRRRIKVPRPADALKGDGAIEVSINGKAPYPIKFNEVVAVPYPIFQRLAAIKAVRRFQRTLENGEVTTEFDHSDPKYHFNDLGDDPDTQDRATDLGDWYRQKGPAWLRALKTHELRTIATVCQITQTTRNDAGTGTRPMNHDELMQGLMIAFYNEVDVDELLESEAQGREAIPA